MHPLLLIIGTIGCSGDPAPEPAAPPPATAEQSTAKSGSAIRSSPVPGGPGPRGTTAAEDLRSSWHAGLAASVPEAPNGECPDADADGAPDALRCGAAAKTLDCDDRDPSVGPSTERWIPAGPFLMGSASDHAGRDEGPVHVVRLAGFCLDVHEASASDVGAWAVSSATRLSGPELANLSEEGVPVDGHADHPATGLTWDEARQYCMAIGKSLPTEAQWEKAARGGCELGADPGRCDPSDLRPYPWGHAAPDCTLANHQAGGMPGPARLCNGSTLPVDSLPDGAGPYGHLHMSGNAWEWVTDAYHPAVYDADGRTDPGGPEEGPYRVLRGGGWSTFGTNMRTANRFRDLVMGSPTGVRCARSTVASVPDPVPPLLLVTLSGEVRPAVGRLEGRALYVTAFDAADFDPETGLLAPGRSPAAETRLTPNGADMQAFQLDVPAGGPYMLSAALDAGAPGGGDDFVAPSGTGGMGQAAENPIAASEPVNGIRIRLQAPPETGPAGTAGPRGPGHPLPGGPRNPHPDGPREQQRRGGK